MNIRKLSVPSLLDFVTIARCGSINKAALELNISQSSLTRSLQRLEANLGAQLIIRSSQGIELTDLGKRMLEHGFAIQEELRQASTEVERVSGKTPDRIAIGMSPTIAQAVGPRSVLALVHGKSQVQVQIVEAIKPHLVDELTLGKLDMFVAMSNTEEELPGIQIEYLFSDSVGLVVRREHPLVDRLGKLNWRDLQGFGWILPDLRARMLHRATAHFERSEFEFPRNVIHTASIAFAKQTVLISDRIAIVPFSVFRSELRAGRAVVLEGPWASMSRDFCLYSRIEKNRSSVFANLKRAFTHHLRAVVSTENALE